MRGVWSRNEWGEIRGYNRFQSIRPAPRNYFLFPLPGSDPDGDGQQLDRGCCKPAEVKAGLGKYITDPREGGGGRAELGEGLLVDSPGDTPFRVRDVGGDYVYGKHPGEFPMSGGETDNGATPPEMS